MQSWKRKQYCRMTAVLLAAAMLFEPIPALGAEAYEKTRSESVYIDLAADGKPLSIISSVYLTNYQKEATLTDRTSLTDVSNVLGNDKPQLDGERVTFKADGEDVCYQGTGHTTPPVSVSIAYTLDGAPIEAEALRGKSGKVTIQIQTQNHSAAMKLVDGEPVKLYTPFSVICMMTLNESFSAIQTDHGQVRAGGGAVSVLGVLHPGLKESLGLTDAEDIADGMRVEAEVRDFSMDGITFIAMTGLVDEGSLSSLDDVQELIDGIGELADATDELYDGAADMRDGVAEYVDGVKELRDGAKELREGTNEYVNGVCILHSGLLDAVDGMCELKGGVAQLSGGIAEMQKQLGSQIADSSGAMAYAAATTGLIAQYTGITDPVILANIKSVIYNSYYSASQTMLTQLYAAIAQLGSGAGKASSGAQEFYVGLKKIASGSAELAQNGKELYDGTVELEDGVIEMDDGTQELYDGTVELTDGVAEFRDEGVKEMQEQTADIGVSLKRKDALLALSDAYTSYSCTDPAVAGSVEFIMTSAAIKAQAPIETQTDTAPSTDVEVVEAEDGGWFHKIWTKIKSWFTK